MHRTAAILVTLAGSAASTQLFPAQFELSSLDGTNGFVLNGIDAADRSGHSVSSAGDFNGDGFDDLIIGAYTADPNGMGRAGECYVVFGGAGVGSATPIELASLDGSNGFILNGIDQNDRCGFSVSSAGDVNGDGFDDLIIGAYYASTKDELAGESYIVFGGAGVGSGGVIELSGLDGANGFVLRGVDAFDRSGQAVATAGDVNGDGFGDMMIGAASADPNGQTSGETYVVFGGAGIGASGVFELSDLDGANGFVLRGVNMSDFSGLSLASAGDVNADSYDDLIIGAAFADPNGMQSGESYVVFGGVDTGAAGVIELSNLDGTDGFVLNGIDADDQSGYSVSYAGDINGDGVDDLVIGAHRADVNDRDRAGESYVVFGGAGIGSNGVFELVDLDGTNGFVLNGIDRRDYSGIAVTSGGDINGDGFCDLVVGASGADPNDFNRAGESYVVFGSAGIGAGGVIEFSALDGSNGFTINGAIPGDRTGEALASAGDFNGDGIDDLIIGAKYADPISGGFRERAGKSFVVFGRSPVVNPADLSGDGCVGSEDLAILLAAWGSGDASADLDESGAVGSSDLAILLAAWGSGCD